jgi:Ca2+-transporting ATPase
MALGQLIHIFNVRKTKGFGLDKSLFKNPYLPGALSISVISQLMVIYLPFFNRIMETTPLDVAQWLWVLLFSSVPTLLIQLKRKLFSSRA